MKKDDAIAHFGSMAKLAKALGITAPAVHKWSTYPPMDRQAQIEELTGGELLVTDESADNEPADPKTRMVSNLQVAVEKVHRAIVRSLGANFPAFALDVEFRTMLHKMIDAEMDRLINDHRKAMAGYMDGKPATPQVRRTLRKVTANGERGTRLLYDALPAEWEAWARGKFPALDPVWTFDEFRDYWIAKPGAAGRKTDWTATWRNWCRKATVYQSGRRRPDAQTWDKNQDAIQRGIASDRGQVIDNGDLFNGR